MARGLAAMMSGGPVQKKKSWKEKMKKVVEVAGLHGCLVIGCVIYACLGALLFRALERPYELAIKNSTLVKLDEMREEIIAKMKSLQDKITDKKKLEQHAAELLDAYTEQLFKMFQHPGEISGMILRVAMDICAIMVIWISSNVFDSVAYDVEYLDLWAFPSAVLFTSTTMVPVGFGLVTPLTLSGRVCLVIYALIGIPLALVTSGDLGRFLCSYIGKFFGEKVVSFEAFLIGIVVAYPLLGGLLISYASELDVADAIYYSSITILTVGFGDMSPPIPIPFLIVYIIFGVMLMTICVDVVAANAIHHIHFMGRQLGQARALATRMVKMAQKISISKGLGLGMAQLGAFARMGIMGGQYDGRPSNEPPSALPLPDHMSSSISGGPFDPCMRLKYVDWPSDFYTLSYDMDHPFIDDDMDEKTETTIRQEIPGDSLSDFIIKTSLSPMDEHYKSQDFI